MNPGGYGRGRGHGKRRRRRMMGFLQPCLLLMLHRDDDHGYNLFNSLDEFGLNPEAHDPSKVYRALRQMEESGLVTSYEGEGSLGPQRRVYRLTKEGRQYLDTWVQDLRRAKHEIELLLSAYMRDVKNKS
jgi:PadR family transcriptional regulator, regulatory protein PadR